MLRAEEAGISWKLHANFSPRHQGILIANDGRYARAAIVLLREGKLVSIKRGEFREPQYMPLWRAQRYAELVPKRVDQQLTAISQG